MNRRRSRSRLGRVGVSVVVAPRRHRGGFGVMREREELHKRANCFARNAHSSLGTDASLPVGANSRICEVRRVSVCPESAPLSAWWEAVSYQKTFFTPVSSRFPRIV